MKMASYCDLVNGGFNGAFVAMLHLTSDRYGLVEPHYGVGHHPMCLHEPYCPCQLGFVGVVTTWARLVTYTISNAS